MQTLAQLPIFYTLNYSSLTSLTLKTLKDTQDAIPSSFFLPHILPVLAQINITNLTTQ